MLNILTKFAATAVYRSQTLFYFTESNIFLYSKFKSILDSSRKDMDSSKYALMIYCCLGFTLKYYPYKRKHASE